MKNKKIIMIALALATLLSIFGGTRLASPKVGYASTIQALDEKKNTVIAFSLTAAAASVAVAAIPGDTTTPIADKFADLSSTFLIVLCAIFLEKYLLSMTGFVSFGILIPIACILGILYLYSERQKFLQIASKFALAGCMIAFVIPVSVGVSNAIEFTYNFAKNMDEEEKIETPIETPSVEEEKKLGLWDQLLASITNGVNSITEGVSNTVKQFQEQFIDIMESLAVLIVTSCVIPIAVIYFMVKMMNVILGLNIDLSSLSKKFIPKKKSRRITEE